MTERLMAITVWIPVSVYEQIQRESFHLGTSMDVYVEAMIIQTLSNPDRAQEALIEACGKVAV